MIRLTNQPSYRLNKSIISFIILFIIFFILGLGVHMRADDNVILKKDKLGNTIFFIVTGSETDIKVQIQVKVSEVFSIQIESNMSTGYTWELTPANKPTPKRVKYVTREYLDQEESSEERLGAPGYDVFTFQALTQGEAIYEIRYLRPWEKDVPPIKVCKIFINVKR